MNGRIPSFGLSGNPVVQILSLLGLGVLMIGAVVLGAIILAFVLGFAVIAAAVFYVRLWWLRRKFMRRGGQAAQNPTTRDTIEVEYTVVEERDPRDRRD